MLRKNTYFLVVNTLFFKLKKNYTTPVRLSIWYNTLKAHNNLDFYDINFFKKNVFIGVAISLQNWENFKKVSNLSLNNIYWQFIKGYSFYG
jgi:hypothetical protein